MQQTFVVAFEELKSFEGTSEPEMRRWLRQIMRQRVAHAKPEYCGTAKREIAREVPLDRLGRLPVDYRTPEQIALATERANEWEWAKQQVSAQHRLVLELHAEDSLNYEQISTTIGRSVEPVRAMYSRARYEVAVLIRDRRARLREEP